MCAATCRQAREKLQSAVFFIKKTDNYNEISKTCVLPLDELQKKWYDSIMDTILSINQKIGKNIMTYRKAMGLTQAELAEKINYSDKSVSKWESGNGAPDIYILMKLADIFGVTVNDLIGKETPIREEEKKQSFAQKVMIILLSCTIVWLVATCVFVNMQLTIPEWFEWWLVFLYALPLNAVILIVFSAVWKFKTLNFIGITTIIWTALLCLYLTTDIVGTRLGDNVDGAWLVFLLGVPLQVMEILWAYFRHLLRVHKNGGVKNGETAENAEAQKEIPQAQPTAETPVQNFEVGKQNNEN